MVSGSALSLTLEVTLQRSSEQAQIIAALCGAGKHKLRVAAIFELPGLVRFLVDAISRGLERQTYAVCQMMRAAQVTVDRDA